MKFQDEILVCRTAHSEAGHSLRRFRCADDGRLVLMRGPQTSATVCRRTDLPVAPSPSMSFERSATGATVRRRSGRAFTHCGVRLDELKANRPRFITTIFRLWPTHDGRDGAVSGPRARARATSRQNSRPSSAPTSRSSPQGRTTDRKSRKRSAERTRILSPAFLFHLGAMSDGHRPDLRQCAGCLGARHIEPEDWRPRCTHVAARRDHRDAAPIFLRSLPRGRFGASPEPPTVQPPVDGDAQSRRR